MNMVSFFLTTFIKHSEILHRNVETDFFLSDMKFPGNLKVAVVSSFNIFELNITEDKVVASGGLELGLLQMISQALKTEFQLLVPADREWGRPLDSGQWTGMIGMLQRNEVDIAMSEISLSEKRFEVVRYSHPYNIDAVTFATKSIKSLSRENTLLDPFTHDIWISLVAAQIIFTLILCFMAGHSVRNIALYVVGTTLGQGWIYPYKKSYKRIILFSWFVGAMFFSMFYKSVLLSFLSVPLREKAIDTKEELADALMGGKYRCYSYERSSVFASMATSADPHTRLIAKLIAENKWYMSESRENIGMLLKLPNVAVISPRIEFKKLIQDTIHMSDESFDIDMLGIAMAENFCCKEEVNSVVNRIVGSGIYEKNFRDYNFKKSQQNRKNETFEVTPVFKPFRLYYLSEPFLLLVSGYVLSSVSFIAEIIFFKVQKQVRN